MSKNKNSYAFVVAAEIVSDKEFKDIPYEELIKALELRLEQLKKSPEEGAFDSFDCMPVVPFPCK